MTLVLGFPVFVVKKMSDLHKKSASHLKDDIKNYKKRTQEDKQLMKTFKKFNKKFKKLMQNLADL